MGCNLSHPSPLGRVPAKRVAAGGRVSRRAATASEIALSWHQWGSARGKAAEPALNQAQGRSELGKQRLGAMRENWTARSRRVIFFAQEEAAGRGTNVVEPEHVLLALLRERDCVAVRVLDRCGIQPARLRSDID